MGLFGSTSVAQRPLSRSIGNAQARNPALPGMPAYGNTTNPNGAQTAVQSPMVAPSPQVFGAVRQTEQNQLQSMPTTPPPAPYPGGDVPGLASFYRNRAAQNYAVPPGFVQPDAVGSSVQAGKIAGTLPVGPNGFVNPGEVSRFNGYDGYTQAFNDPTRLTPMQREFIARQSAQAAGQMDPTGLSQRFGAGSALGQQAAGIAAGQAAVAAGTHVDVPGGYGNLPSFRPVDHQAEQQRLANLAAASPERALDQSHTGTQFAYRGANGEIVSTNRLGMLQQMDQNDPAVKSAIAFQMQKNAALAQKQQDRKSFTRAENGGLTGRQKTKLEGKERSLRRAVRNGVIDQETMDNRLAGIEKNYQTNNKWGDLQRTTYSSPPAGLRLPNGELPKEAREKASDVASKLTDENYTDADPKFNQQAQSVRAMGLTDKLTVKEAVSKIINTAVPKDPGSRQLYADSLKAYWSSMNDKSAAWNPKDKSNAVTKMLDELSMLKNPADINKWLEEKWMPHLGFDKDGNEISADQKFSGYSPL